MNENLEKMDLIPCEKEDTEIMETDAHSGISKGLSVVIVGILIVGTIVGGKKLKKMWDKHRAKKKEGSEVEAVDVSYVEVEETSNDISKNESE